MYMSKNTNKIFERLKENSKIEIREIKSPFTPLKKSNRTAVNSSTKLPVTDLNEAPQRGVDSNIHWYNNKKLEKDDFIIIKIKYSGLEYVGKVDEISGFTKEGIKIPGAIPILKINIISYEEDPFDFSCVSSGKETIFINDIESVKKIIPKGDIINNICSFLGGKSKRRKTNRRKTNKRKTNK